MRDRNKGFSLVELMVTITVLAITLSFAVPAFTSSIDKAKADTEIGDLYRAFNYARLEAINRAVNVRITPSTAGVWTGILNIQTVTPGAVNTQTIRVVPAMAASAVIAAGPPAYIEFNNLGALASPTTAVAFAYTRGAAARSMGVCLTGRLILGGNCP
jgi:type IV fimbrial biogenesis protein FimU